MASRSPLGRTDSDVGVAAFQTWCKSEHVLAPKCSIGHIEATGRGVIAEQDISSGEVVVEVPDDALILAETSPICKQLQGESPEF